MYPEMVLKIVREQNRRIKDSFNSPKKIHLNPKKAIISTRSNHQHISPRISQRIDTSDNINNRMQVTSPYTNQQPIYFINKRGDVDFIDENNYRDKIKLELEGLSVPHDLTLINNNANNINKSISPMRDIQVPNVLVSNAQVNKNFQNELLLSSQQQQQTAAALSLQNRTPYQQLPNANHLIQAQPQAQLLTLPQFQLGHQQFQLNTHNQFIQTQPHHAPFKLNHQTHLAALQHQQQKQQKYEQQLLQDPLNRQHQFIQPTQQALGQHQFLQLRAAPAATFHTLGAPPALSSFAQPQFILNSQFFRILPQ